MALRMDSHHDTRWLCRWLEHLDTIAGMNLQFDIAYLRAHHPVLRDVLNERHALLDLSYINYQDSELRPERSLKNIGPVKGVYRYSEEELQERLPTFAKVLHYNGTDTHNTLLAIAACATDICTKNAARDPLYHKLTPFSISFYSDLIWACIAMTEAGVPFHRPSLESYAQSLQRTIALCSHMALSLHGVRISGERSKKSKAHLLDQILSSIEARGTPVRNDPMLAFTDKLRDVKFDIRNQNLLLSYLPPGSSLALALKWCRKHTEAQKMLGTYCYPLLWRQRSLSHGHPVRKSVLVPQPGAPFPCPPTPPSSPSIPSSTSSPLPAAASPASSPTSPTTSSLISTPPSPSPSARPSSPASGSSSRPSPSSASSSRPPINPLLLAPEDPGYPGPIPLPPSTVPGSLNPEVWLSHPSWFIVPTSVKDDSGSSGGTLQVRITCKDFQHQTDPEEIAACRRSRWVGGALAEMDLDQAELRTGALLSGEESLLGAFLRGEDVHTRRAIAIWTQPGLEALHPALLGKPVDSWKSHGPFKDSERDVGKHVNFADFFWASAQTIQATILKMSGRVVPLSILQTAVDRRAIDRPQLWAWQNAQLALARAQGYLALPFLGSSRYFAGGSKDESSEIINFPIQSTAAATLVFIKLYLRPRLPRDILLFLNVYDSLSFDLRYPKRDFPILKDLVHEAVTYVETQGYWSLLQSHYGHRVPLGYKLSLKDPH